MTTLPTNDPAAEQRAARRRLWRGYAPLTIFVLAFALITWLVPSVSRERDVQTVREGYGPAASGALATGGAAAGGLTGGGGKAGGTAVGANAGGIGGGGTGSATGVARASGSNGGSAGAAGPAGSGSGGGSGPAVTGATSACPHQSQQVSGDPYSPPCISFSGNNGGATAPGVTGNTITVAYRFPSDFASANKSAAELGGASLTTTEPEAKQTMQGLVNYFNAHFQFYGRKLQIKFFDGQGAELSEAQNEDQPQAAADATTASQQLHAFADIGDGSSVLTQVYADALARQHVLAIGIQDLSIADMQAAAPYFWGPATDCDTVMESVMGMVDNELANKPATYAGGSLKGHTRKFAIIYPQNPTFQYCVNDANAMAKAAGVTIADELTYQLNVATITAQDDNLVAKLANDQITSVMLLTDPGSPLFLSERAAQQDYTPEWIESGAATVDDDQVAQLYDQPEWAHAFGLSFNGPRLPVQDTLAYAAYKSVISNEPAVNALPLMYQGLYELALGIEMAGPDLTPATFEQGMRAYPGSQAGAPNLDYGTWKFPAGKFNPVEDAWFVSWNPNAISTDDGQAGAYMVDSRRYIGANWPRGSAPVPGGFPVAPTSG